MDNPNPFPFSGFQEEYFLTREDIEKCKSQEEAYPDLLTIPRENSADILDKLEISELWASIDLAYLDNDISSLLVGSLDSKGNLVVLLSRDAKFNTLSETVFAFASIINKLGVKAVVLNWGSSLAASDHLRACINADIYSVRYTSTTNALPQKDARDPLTFSVSKKRSMSITKGLIKSQNIRFPYTNSLYLTNKLLSGEHTALPYLVNLCLIKSVEKLTPKPYYQGGLVWSEDPSIIRHRYFMEKCEAYSYAPVNTRCYPIDIKVNAMAELQRYQNASISNMVSRWDPLLDDVLNITADVKLPSVLDPIEISLNEEYSSGFSKGDTVRFTSKNMTGYHGLGCELSGVDLTKLPDSVVTGVCARDIVLDCHGKSICISEDNYCCLELVSKAPAPSTDGVIRPQEYDDFMGIVVADAIPSPSLISTNIKEMPNGN